MSRAARRVRLPALVVGVLLALAVLLLVGVSLFVDVPGGHVAPPTVGIGTAVIPTPLGSVGGAGEVAGDAVFSAPR
ncbi:MULTISPECIES: hypothetical protein [Saccharopolyspora]|uniref:hypothetical protein n=1 Tax=Saccharopolyspora TaxID=1835 RepID=UPI001CD427BD|nr:MULTISPECIES: hypothetical protein [Saccharopolyspora]MCA1188242.1 hypothetical protein [Saccharopolyspora sp. 6T]MCA1192690.1 hypothetical protein [Saccharopolyspora sp. 6V]MCA1227925.1 hypothetical protein [Saccharopolyspora sp. 6M]MCA1280478.1 hypothetical protein [Saccharopolyspora sp. 7B]